MSKRTVLALEKIDGSLFLLSLERGDLLFSPGDCVALHTDDGKSRPYSIASGNSATELRFLIRELPGGEVSSWLAQRKPGDAVVVSPPFGWFRPGQHGDRTPSVFVATGTGIAPFLSHRETFPEQPPAQVLYGVRHATAAAGFDQLNGWCNVSLAVSREVHAAHHHGRVTDLLDTLPTRAHFYLCGQESMVREVSDMLQRRGVHLFNIHREVFFHDMH